MWLAVVPPECIVFNVLSHTHGDAHDAWRWSTCLTPPDSSQEDPIARCSCGHWACPCCQHMFSEQVLLQMNHEDALAEIDMANEDALVEIERVIMDMESSYAHDKDLMDQCDHDERAFS